MTRPMIEVLLVEDDPGDVVLTREGLATSTLSLNLHVVDNGEKAVDFLDRRSPYAAVPRPDLVILDLNLPRLNGFEVLAHIKANDSLKDIPVVVLTTSKAKTDADRSTEIGADCFLSKPPDFGGFARVVKSIEAFWSALVPKPGELTGESSQ